MKILAISVHPDDETLGCGGTLLKHLEKRDETFWLILTDANELAGYSKEFISKRETQISNVSAAFHFKRTYRLGFPTTKLVAIELNEIMSQITSVLNEVKPDVIYMVNRSDIHTDHQVAARAILSCTKSFRNPYLKRLLMYECLSETELAPPLPENIFVPNAFSDISDYIGKKIEIMKLYDSELQEPPLPRSIENIMALARFRGSMVSADYAEAFMLLRDIF